MLTSRRVLIQGAAAALIVPVSCRAGEPRQAGTRPRTPELTRGPFHPFPKHEDSDADLAWLKGHDARARGEVIEVAGTVFDMRGEPVPGATLEIWQANAAGRYAHPRDTNPAPLDPNFAGYALIRADAAGRYRITTVRPGGYPAFASWSRPPHIHFDIDGRIATQMFFADDPLNAQDRILAAIPADQRPGAFARADGTTADGRARFRYDLVVARG
jgi:protocatechuate 3,4-dioxygenase beta subunit